MSILAMSDTWVRALDVMTGVTTPLGALGLLLGLGFFALLRRFKHERDKLEALPAEERLEYVAGKINRYKLNAEGMNDAARQALIRAELNARYRFAMTTIKILAGLVAFCFLVSAAAYLGRGDRGSAGEDRQSASDHRRRTDWSLI